MCVGKTNRKVPKSAQHLAEFAGEQASTHRRLIAPQEIAQVEQLQDEGYQRARGQILEGRANADAAASEHQAQTNLRQMSGQRGGGSFADTNLASGRISGASQGSRTKGVLLGGQTAQTMTMGDRFGALQTGAGHARGVTSGLASASRSELIEQEADAAGEMALGSAYGDAIATAAMGGYTAIKRAGDSDVDSGDLSLLGKGLRKMGMGQQQPSTMPGQQEYGQWKPPTNDPYGLNSPYNPNNNMPGGTTYPQSTQSTSTSAPKSATKKYKSFSNWI
jgi:hypothetical protein